MTELTLLAKIYNSHQMKQINSMLADFIGDLDVHATIKGTLAGRWVLLEVSGEDEAVATKLLEREIGFCPTKLENVKKFASLKGYVTSLEKSKEELFIDIGVFQPNAINASVALGHLQAKFADGKKMPLKRIVELWGLSDYLPLDIKVLEVKAEENEIVAELQASQIKKFELWKDSLLDRLIVIGASKQEIDAAINQEGLGRDVIELESLGLFEHALVCKLGTVAAGLIRRIGRRLRKANFTVFNPKKALEVLNATT